MLVSFSNKYQICSFSKGISKNTKNIAKKEANEASAFSYSPAFYYPVSFGAKTLYRGLSLIEKDESGASSKIPAKVSLLTPKNRSDYNKMARLSEDWSDTKLGPEIAEAYMYDENDNLKTFVMEEDKYPAGNRIVSAATVLQANNSYILEYLQAAPEIVENHDIKGAGELLLYAVVKDAQKNNIDSLVLYPYDSLFSYYKHIGLHPMECTGSYGLKSSEFNKFLKRVEKRYSFSCT